MKLQVRFTSLFWPSGMAGITSSFPPLKFFLARSTKATPYLRPLFSSSESKVFRFHFCYPNSLVLHKTSVSVPFALTSSVTEYGGDQWESGGEHDAALDIDAIGSDTVRLIDQKQNMVGVVPKSQAVEMADAAELDLVILSPDGDPPVVRIMDYSKYLYEQEKKKKLQQKKSAAKRMDLKELKMGYNIDQHDYMVRLKAAKKFLKAGDKVKVIVSLKGRENDFRNIAIDLLRRFQNDIGELATEENKNFRERNIFIVLLPNKAVIQRAKGPTKKTDEPEADEASAGVGAMEI